ncbi:hypothetical protein OG206_17315 [Streptomyces sp. NBC_01341]|uniref:hypothetical protein n=1 Tax=Streptomyces sp. NBC_01341 TaxID=2903831 RepID=UPI002E0E2B9D|nr:hypothetical protein OG206_17315 [Streptomyces sp. NBC_01341]
MRRKPTNSKAGLILSLGSSAFAVIRSVKQIRRTRGGQDRLTTANTVAGLLPLVTSALLILRRLRGRSRQQA